MSKWTNHVGYIGVYTPKISKGSNQFCVGAVIVQVALATGLQMLKYCYLVGYTYGSTPHPKS